jgi:peptidoglycan/xylan/chitin deacetylase (PgdA/CDA1 family)
MYHGIGRTTDDPFGLFVSPDRFDEQMRTLRALGLQGVSLGELGDAMARGERHGLVGLTFDDAYLDLMAWALPVLHKSGFTATVFAVSGLLGGENVWDPPPRRGLMTSADLQELTQQGIEVGSHGQTHVRLAGLDARRLHQEIAGSRAALAEVTGVEPRCFCYPYGSVDQPAVLAVRAAGYQYACAVHRVPELPTDLATPRVGVTHQDRSLRLTAKLVLRGR